MIYRDWQFDPARREFWGRARVLLVKLALKASSRIRGRTPVGLIDPATGRYLPTMTGTQALRAQRRKAGIPSGRARGNWNLTIDGPSPAYDWEKKDPTGVNLTMEHARLAMRLKVGDAVFISNGLPYIGPLEHGSSKQAPQGMVRLTFAELEPLVRQATAELRAGVAGASVDATMEER